MTRCNELLSQRRSCRSYLDTPVERSLIESILADAARSPSGDNHQPWQVLVLQGNAKDTLCDALVNEFRSGKTPSFEYPYYPGMVNSEPETTWFDQYRERRKACGLALYGHMGITREDTEGKLALYEANYRAFNAPVVLLFFIHYDFKICWHRSTTRTRRRTSA